MNKSLVVFLLSILLMSQRMLSLLLFLLFIHIACDMGYHLGVSFATLVQHLGYPFVVNFSAHKKEEEKKKKNVDADTRGSCGRVDS